MGRKKKKSNTPGQRALLYVRSLCSPISQYGTAEEILITAPPRVLALGADCSGLLPTASYQAFGAQGAVTTSRKCLQFWQIWYAM
jgi:hypothetical protein